MNTAIPKFNSITSLPTFADRGKAIAKRLESVKADPKYQALPEEHKAKVRADIYNKYVAPSYSGFHLPVPDKDTWVGATGRDTDKLMGKKLSETYGSQGHTSDYWRHNQESNQDLGAGFTKGINNIELFGTKVANKYLMGQFNLTDHFAHYLHLDNPGSNYSVGEKFIKEHVAKTIGNIQDAAKVKVQDANFWLQTHPRDTTIGRLDGIIGEQIAALPLYEALGGPISKLGGPITARLSATPVGKWVAKRLISGTEQFLAQLVTTGGDAGEAGKQAAVGEVALGVLGGAGKIASKVAEPVVEKIASQPLIKKWLAGVIAMGGKPFASELVKSAHAEEEIALSHASEPSTGEGLDKLKQAARATEIKDWMEAQKRRAEQDPVMSKLHEAAKKSANSLAMAMHGKNLNQLSKAQRALVRDRQLALIGEAAQEAPVHLPDLHKMEVEQNITQERQSNPVFNKLAAALEAQGIIIADTVHENALTEISRETGISNREGAFNKAVKVPKRTDVKAVRGEAITPERFASMGVESNAALRAPRNRATFDAAISNKSADGFNAFVDELSKATRESTPFVKEDPAHLLLYHYGNTLEDKSSKKINAAIAYRLRQTEGRSGYSAVDLKHEAFALRTHLYMLARGNQLFTEGNVFRSTKLPKPGAPFSWTKWQHQLEGDGDKLIFQETVNALQRHPQAAKGFKAAWKLMKQTRPNITTWEEYYNYVSNLDSTARKFKMSFQ